MKKFLTPMQYAVTQSCGTEPAFNNEFWNNKEDGWYVDIVSGVPLFKSEDKFDSGTGWPSFTKPFSAEAVVEKVDDSYGLIRTEVRSAAADSHLGHVFNDGPGPNGLRYCINSASLKFIRSEDLEKKGYGHYVAKEGAHVALFAAGCFWGTEGYFRQLSGVLGTEVGYSGGWVESPEYRAVTKGDTGHAETLKIIFNPQEISYKELLYHFFRMHDPSALNRQGNDIGTQYRSAVFFIGKEQQEASDFVISQLSKQQKIVTEVREAGAFYTAEEYHQDYLEKNPNGYCHVDLSLALDPLLIP